MASAQPWRKLLDLLPVRPSEASRFRGAVSAAARNLTEGSAATAGSPATPRATAAGCELAAREAEFMLSSQAELAELNLRYFPTSGMTDQQVVEATAARVGFSLDKDGSVREDGSVKA